MLIKRSKMMKLIKNVEINWIFDIFRPVSIDFVLFWLDFEQVN